MLRAISSASSCTAKYVEELVQTVSHLVPKLTLKSHFCTTASLIVQLSLMYSDFSYSPDLSTKQGIRYGVPSMLTARLHTYLALMGKASYDPLVRALSGICDPASVKVLDIVLMWCKDFLKPGKIPGDVNTKACAIFCPFYREVVAILEKGYKVSFKLLLLLQRLLKIRDNNNEHFIARGTVTEDRVEKFNVARDQLKSVLADLVAISSYLPGVDPPSGIDIPEDAVVNHASSAGIISLGLIRQE